MAGKRAIIGTCKHCGADLYASTDPMRPVSLNGGSVCSVRDVAMYPAHQVERVERL